MLEIAFQTPLTPVYGDVTGDGVINIADLTRLIDYLLDMPNLVFVEEAADIFPDGEINIRDVTRLIDILIEVMN